jgi:signal transduction histidine kinase
VIQTGEVYLIPDTGMDPFYKTIFDEEFGKVRRMILAPIKGESQFYGVLGLRGFGDVPFPKHAVKVAEMVGLQLGLYHRLATTIRKLKAEQKWQVQIWADISHQLKGPVNQAKRRSELAIEAVGGDKSPFLPVRGLCRKAQHVVANLGMIADLARGKDIRPNCSVFSYSSLIKMLIEASQDTELMIDPRRQIRFNVSRESFLWPMVLDKVRIELDPDLLEQAVNNVFDNAAKYSYESTIVEILGSQSDGMFYITVRNVGLPIRGEETRLCLLREWRGKRARMTTQEGSGIGLWIVDNIMRVHGGRLIVLPTTAESQTEVKLGFPFSR